MEWIDCNERMPERKGHYLAYREFPGRDWVADYSKFIILCWYEGRWWHDFAIPDWWVVTHWAELPEPPAPEAEEE